MKMIFHFGAHKTASSHFQHNLNLNRDRLSKKGIAYLKIHQERGELYRRMERLRDHCRDEDFNVEAEISFIRNAINRQIRDYDSVIISFEPALGDMFHYKHGNLYPDAEITVNLYKRILKGHDVIPVYALRNYDDFFRSIYKWQIRKKQRPITLNEYISQIYFSRHRWTDIVELLDNTFYRPVRVFTYEDYKNKWKEIITCILGLTHKSICLEELAFDEERKNAARKAPTLDFYYTVNCLFQHFPAFHNKPAVNKRTKKILRPFAGLGCKFLLAHQTGEVPPVNDVRDYQKEVAVLKGKYGILNR